MAAVLAVRKVIRHRSDGWHVFSESGKHLGGPYPTKAQAVTRLRQIEGHKVRKIDLDPFDLAGRRLEVRAASVFTAGLESMPDTVSLSELERQAEGGKPAEVRVAEVAAGFGGLIDVLADTIEAAGSDEASGGRAVVKEDLTLDWGFDLVNAEVVRAAETQAGERIVEITRQQRTAIRDLIRRAVAEGGHPFVVARQIRPLIGLHSRWATAVLNHRFRLEANGVSPAEVQRLTARYHARLLRARATNIARTEILRAANMGKRMAWEQAWKEGYMGRRMPDKEWAAASDAEPVCAATDGQQVRMDDDFSTALGNFDMPPAHPGCRCTAVLIFEETP